MIMYPHMAIAANTHEIVRIAKAATSTTSVAMVDIPRSAASTHLANGMRGKMGFPELGVFTEQGTAFLAHLPQLGTSHGSLHSSAHSPGFFVHSLSPIFTGLGFCRVS